MRAHRVALCAVLAGVAAPAAAQVVAGNGTSIGEQPAVTTHLEQAQIESGQLSLMEIIAAGEALFTARFNALDGQGRPASTGTGAPRLPVQPAFSRTSGPDANACSSCHNDPVAGGNGDFTVNVFVLAQALDPVTFDTSAANSNERNTIGMHGAGAIEMLAREMTVALHAIRDEALAAAQDTGTPQTRSLRTKGVSFGEVTAMPDGRIDPTGIEGVDWDLIVKPFHQKGAVVSLREFTNNAMNHHHGIQTTERFGVDTDPDMDGYTNELTVGDITAVTLFQAAMPVPGRQRPANAELRKVLVQGERLFADTGCAGCHRPRLRLEDAMYSEPNPFNPPGNANPQDIGTVSFNLTSEGMGNRLKPLGRGAVVRAYTDLKRYNLCDEELAHFCNEQISQGTLAGFADPASFTVPDQPRPTEAFLTRRLWDVGSSDPYGHRGDLTTMTEAIHFHGGDARESRDAFFALSDYSQATIIEFLKSLQIK
ncbi:MAG: di-heme oxidoredictase family protein [Pseudomonadota bacterium]